jgi:hypothetical protein
LPANSGGRRGFSGRISGGTSGGKAPGSQGSGAALPGILRTATLVSVLGRPMRPAEPSVDGDRKRGRADAEVQAPVPGEPGLEFRETEIEVR